MPGQRGDPPALREILLEKQPGDVLHEITESGDRCGSFLIDATSPEALDALEQDLLGRISVVTEPMAVP